MIIGIIFKNLLILYEEYLLAVLSIQVNGRFIEHRGINGTFNRGLLLAEL